MCARSARLYYTGAMFETALPGARGSDATELLRELVRTEDRLYRLVAERRVLTDLDLSEFATMWVSFASTRFVRCSFAKAHLENTFFDFTSFEECEFGESACFNVSFAGARFERCSFRGATMDQCNFNGIEAKECDFSDASLRRSRFINARLQTTRFINCDLHDAIFRYSLRNEVTFKHSNVQEAFL